MSGALRSWSFGQQLLRCVGCAPTFLGVLVKNMDLRILLPFLFVHFLAGAAASCCAPTPNLHPNIWSHNTCLSIDQR